MKAQGIYLAGSIEGISTEEANGWRDAATEMLRQHDIPVYNPCRRIPYRDEMSGAPRQQQNAAKRIVKMDLQDIAQSTVILADLRDSTPGKKWGTLAEIAHAHTKNKIIIVLMDEGQFMHPFVDFYSTEIHFKLEDAIDASIAYFN